MQLARPRKLHTPRPAPAANTAVVKGLWVILPSGRQHGSKSLVCQASYFRVGLARVLADDVSLLLFTWHVVGHKYI